MEGLPLARTVDKRLSVDLELFSRGGLLILDKIERQQYVVLHNRPAIGKLERVRLLVATLARAAFYQGCMTPLERSYAHCRRRSSHTGSQFLLLLSVAVEAAARCHVRCLRVHALLR